MRNALARYLAETGQTDTQFAVRLGVDRSYIHRLRTGSQTPSLAMAHRIQALTGGSVPATADSWPTAGADSTTPTRFQSARNCGV